MRRRIVAALAALAAIAPLAALAPAGARTLTPGADAEPGTEAQPSTLGAAARSGDAPIARGTAIGGDLPIVGDWDGNGTTTVGVRRGATFYLRNSNSPGPGDLAFDYGLPGDVPIVGDWDANGTTTVGVRRGPTFFLRDDNSSGDAISSFDFGLPDDVPVAGDWDGDGRTTIGVWRRGTFYLRNSNTPGPADIVATFGLAGDQPLVGDWDGNGTTTIGVRRPWCTSIAACSLSVGVLFRNTNASGWADGSIAFGEADDIGLAGDWDGDGTDTPGIRRGTMFFLSNILASASADVVFNYGEATITPTNDPRIAGNEVAVTQRQLMRLGLPVPAVTGIDDDRTRQAACGWRWITARPGGRSAIAPGDAVGAMTTWSLQLPPTGQISFWVVLGCQLGFETAPDGTVVAVHLVSTGMPGYDTPTGVFEVWAREQGWVDSSLYPTYDGRAMLNPAYFIGWAYAVHGSTGLDPSGATWPMSHGCIRVAIDDVDVTARIQQVIVT
jgi:hypothetical protein